MPIPLLQILLIDAQRVDPQKPRFPALSQMEQQIPQVHSDPERPPVDPDLARVARVAPCITDRDVRRPAMDGVLRDPEADTSTRNTVPLFRRTHTALDLQQPHEPTGQGEPFVPENLAVHPDMSGT